MNEAVLLVFYLFLRWFLLQLSMQIFKGHQLLFFLVNQNIPEWKAINMHIFGLAEKSI